MAIKGPSFAGPLTGWSGASLVPNATVAATAAPTSPFGNLLQNSGGSAAFGKTNDISKYNLTQEELGVTPDLRRTAPQSTPLEALLAAMFPDAAADYNPTAVDPLADPRNPGPAPSLLNTILGNLSQQPSSGSTGYYQGTPTAPTAPFVAPSIPGAPAFLGPAIANLSGFGGYSGVPIPAPGANPLNSLAAVSAIAAEQRIQAAEMEKARKEAETAFFQQQQQKQKAQSMVAQRQRQRLGFAPSGANSGWFSNPTFY